MAVMLIEPSTCICTHSTAHDKHTHRLEVGRHTQTQVEHGNTGSHIAELAVTELCNTLEAERCRHITNMGDQSSYITHQYAPIL